jgi:hypothetical protein
LLSSCGSRELHGRTEWGSIFFADNPLYMFPVPPTSPVPLPSSPFALSPFEEEEGLLAYFHGPNHLTRSSRAQRHCQRLTGDATKAKSQLPTRYLPKWHTSTTSRCQKCILRFCGSMRHTWTLGCQKCILRVCGPKWHPQTSSRAYHAFNSCFFYLWVVHEVTIKLLSPFQIINYFCLFRLPSHLASQGATMHPTAHTD